MSQYYSDPSRANDPHALPDIEIFQLTAEEVAAMDEDLVHEYMTRRGFRLAGFNTRERNRMLNAMINQEGITGGWFYWVCWPGCLPDSVAIGPFASHAEALVDARSQRED